MNPGYLWTEYNSVGKVLIFKLEGPEFEPSYDYSSFITVQTYILYLFFFFTYLSLKEINSIDTRGVGSSTK